ncbi:hypothetical protein Q5762_26555 [Streptomyces sp. P9(2023)]|uniref:hypothetical protein n=1 Tax=Streptomyces sp. P9(2023) TaxID=3064394 RepID=UPI0028F415E1|nr:hypothetical protein [Streptomyces sp. P9(2023)]MDT9691831.1 hypothetical protein [Streptomyces sp. P9(2023)]
MDHSPLLDTVWKLLHERIPGDVPTLIEVPEGGTLRELVAAIGGRAGRSRSLVSDGVADPSLTEYAGLALLEPFGADIGADLLELRAWSHWSHWIGCAEVASPKALDALDALDAPDGTRLFVVLADREDPAAGGLPEGASWAEKLRIVTGWEPMPQPAVDWSAVEAALGTALPSDYKETADLFGAGSFDWYLDLLVPGAKGGLDLVTWAEHDAKHGRTGLLRFGTSEREIDFAWQTGATDPDAWPVVVRHDFRTWERHDYGFGEFVLRMLTDPQLGFPTSRLTAHTFLSFDMS